MQHYTGPTAGISEHDATWLMGEEPQGPQVTEALVLGLIGLIGSFLWQAKGRMT